MIWLLSNLWWALPVLLVLVAAVAAFAGPGLPVVLAALRRVPVRVWLALAAITLLGATFQAGRHYERSILAAAEDKAVAKASESVKRHTDAAKAEKAAARTESKEAADEVRDAVAALPDSCPPLPDGVRESVQRQVQAARAGM